MTHSDMNHQEILGQLRQLRIEIDMLKARAAENPLRKDTRLDRYLEILDEKTDEVGKRIGSVKYRGGDAMDDTANGLKDAVGRLEIARRAAEARFH